MDLFALKDAIINKVSLVPKAANRRRWLIVKSEEGVTELKKEDLIKVLKADGAVAIELLKAANVPVDKAAEVLKSLEGLKPGADKLDDATAGAVIKMLEGIAKSAAPPILDPSVVTVKKEDLDAMQTKITKAEETANNERNLRVAKEFVDLARADMPNLPEVTPATFGPVLKSCAEKLTKEENDLLVKVLKTASTVIAKSELFKSIGGSGGGAAGSALEEVNKQADAMIQKDGKLTHAQAVVAVIASNPDLATRYKAEM